MYAYICSSQSIYFVEPFSPRLDPATKSRITIPVSSRLVNHQDYEGSDPMSNDDEGSKSVQ